MENKYLQFALDTAGIGTWELDPVHSRVVWNDRCRVLFGYEPGEVVSYEEVLRHVHPDDVTQVKEAIKKALDPAIMEPYEVCYRYFSAREGSIRWVLSKGKAFFNEEGVAVRFGGTTQDITETMRDREKVATSERIAKLALESSNAGYFHLVLSTGEIDYSPGYVRIITGTEEKGLPHTLFVEHIHPDDLHLREKAFGTAMQTGLFDYEARVVWHNGSIHWMRAKGTFLNDVSGKPYLLAGTVHDTTIEHQHRDAMQQSEARFRSLVEQAPVATCLLVGRNMKIEIANEMMLNYWDTDASVIGQPLAVAVPELVGQHFLVMLNEVFTTGKTYEAPAEETFLELNGVFGAYYFDLTYKPLRNASDEVYAIMGMAVNVTEQVIARQKLEESELFSRSVIDHSPVAKVVFIGEDMVIRTVNENMLALMGRDASIIGMTFMEAMPEFITTPLISRLRQVLFTGETFYQPEEKLQLIRYGKPYTGYYNYIYKALRNTSGGIYGVMTTATEVTGQVLARQKIEEAEATLRGAVELAELGTWEIILDTGLLDYSDRLRDWFGFSKNEIITIERAYGPVRKDDRPLIKKAITHAITPGTNGIYDVEYTVEAAPGKTRTLHARGKTFFNDKGQAYKISGTVQDVTAQRTIQLALEQEVQERTEELQSVNEELIATIEELNEANKQLLHSNEELAQYAYVASHDLQEPLRKIMIFSGMLEKQENLPEENRDLVKRIANSSERMSQLIRDLLEFSRLLKSETLIRPVDLSVVLTAVISDFELTIEEKKAKVNIGSLPVVEAVGLQMNQLFYNLLSNALKFVRPDTRPQIHVTSRAITATEASKYLAAPLANNTYYQISFSDNGIGFEQKYADQIFEVFKRLHGRDTYPGSGIGLALCRRIVANHGGQIYVESAIGQGTTFYIILPDKATITKLI